MGNAVWKVNWKDQLADTYTYGSEIIFNADGSVSFSNELMPPGTVIHRWYSKTNYQAKRIEPSLPMIDGERPYSLTLNVLKNSESGDSLLIRINFYDRYDNFADSIIIREKKAFFKPSVKTYSYNIELINGGNADFTFNSFILEEVSEKEFDEEQKRIEKIREASYKSEKKWRKSKEPHGRRTEKPDRGAKAKVSKR